MFNFAYPKLLFLLLLVPAYFVLYLWSRHSRSKRLKLFGNPEILQNLMPDASKYKPGIKITLQLIALTSIIIAAARPWGGVISSKTEKEGCEVVIAVDASNSMLAPISGNDAGASRMKSAKLMLEKLIGSLDNDRVGLIVYAGKPYTLIPVTSDFVSAKMFLNSIDPSLIEVQGTNIAEAISMASDSFSPNKDTGKSIVLLTDAEDLENTDDVITAARTAAKNGIQINVVGIGSGTPAMIPLDNGGYFTDETGVPVKTALNEKLAEDIAKAGKGVFVNAANPDALNELIKQIGKVKKTALESSMYVLHDELFPIFVIIAISAIILNMFVLRRKNSWLQKITFFTQDTKK